jgi:3-methyladenine DNA glycosylase Tag
MNTQKEKFDEIYSRACKRKGGKAALQKMLSKPLSQNDLLKITDDRWLSEFTKKIFQSGFVWKVVRNKWPDFEEVFFGFDIDKILFMPDEMVELKATDKRIIRNYNKVKTIRENAFMIQDVAEEYGSFSKFVAEWPSDDIVGLWAFLKKFGTRLGGNTGPYTLRFLGKDTFLLSRDVESYLRSQRVFEGGMTSKRSLAQIQSFFNDLQDQSNKSLQEISQIISFSVGDNYILND